MSSLIRMSEAAALAMHASTYLAVHPTERADAGALAKVCRASKDTMAKVCQILAKAGILGTRRGVGGGYRLRKDPRAVSLARIYELFDGKLEAGACVLSRSRCEQGKVPACIFGPRLASLQAKLALYLRSTTLADTASQCRKNHGQRRPA